MLHVGSSQRSQRLIRIANVQSFVLSQLVQAVDLDLLVKNARVFHSARSYMFIAENKRRTPRRSEEREASGRYRAN